MTNNIATSKNRIIQYLDIKGISKKEFYEKTEIKRGFLDTDKLKSNISDVFLANIIAVYDDMNLYWLITGKGEMLLENQQSPTDTNSTISTDAKFEDLLVDLLSSPKAKKVINHLITERLNPLIENLEAIDAYLAQQVLDRLKGEE